MVPPPPPPFQQQQEQQQQKWILWSFRETLFEICCESPFHRKMSYKQKSYKSNSSSSSSFPVR
jgi:hypothetical protein